jgi:hypothetical protein
MLKPHSDTLSDANIESCIDSLSLHSGSATQGEDTGDCGNNNRYLLLRVVMIAMLTVVSIALWDNFLDLVDFSGAAFITVRCLTAPLVLFLKCAEAEAAQLEARAASSLQSARSRAYTL